MLYDPNFRPAEPDRARLATEVANALFSQLAPVFWVQDANHLSRNQPAYDFLVEGQIGVVLDGRVGRLAGRPIPVKPCVDYYLVPGTLVREWVAMGRRVNGRGAHIYLYKYPLKPGSKEEIGQTRELADWR